MGDWAYGGVVCVSSTDLKTTIAVYNAIQYNTIPWFIELRWGLELRSLSCHNSDGASLLIGCNVGITTTLKFRSMNELIVGDVRASLVSRP